VYRRPDLVTGPRAAALVLLSSAALAGCGGGSDHRAGAASSSSAADAPAATSAKPEVTTTVPTGSVPTGGGAPTTSTPTEAGGGDEEGVRVPAAFRLRDGRLTPATVAVPAFLRIELVIANRDAASHRVAFHGTSLTVAGGHTRSVLVGGLKKGRFPVTVAGGGRAAIVTGAEGGP
jgi:hypothetical protein